MEIFKKNEVKKSYYELILKNSDFSNYFEYYYTISMFDDSNKLYVFGRYRRDVFSIEKSAIKKLNYVTPHTCDCEACKKQGDRVLVLI